MLIRLRPFCNSTSVGELNKQLDSKSMEIRWYIYIKGIDNKR